MIEYAAFGLGVENPGPVGDWTPDYEDALQEVCRANRHLAQPSVVYYEVRYRYSSEDASLTVGEADDDPERPTNFDALADEKTPPVAPSGTQEAEMDKRAPILHLTLHADGTATYWSVPQYRWYFHAVVQHKEMEWFARGKNRATEAVQGGAI